MKSLLALIFVFCIGCASIPVTQAEQQTAAILQSDILTPTHVVTVADKTQIKAALQTDAVVIHQEQAAAASNAKMAKVGRWTIGLGIVFALVVVLMVIRKIVP